MRKRSRKISAVLFLMLFGHSLFTPYYAFALTSGPHQPEYTSYEDAGASDMVNLLTGDMTFNIPIVEVPGPEGSFNIPLSYHAGMGPEQEASWLGLGWNVNVGSITRDVNQFPDDASGQSQVVTVQDLTGIHGWNRTFNHPFRDSWNSQTGYYGDLNLLDIVQVEIGNTTSVGIVGVHVGDRGVSFNAAQFASAAITILTYGAGSAASGAAAVAKQAAIDLAIQTAVSFAMPVNTPQFSSMGNYSYTKDSNSSIKFHTMASLLARVPVISRKKSYHIYLDQTRTEDMYGLLYLGDAPLADNEGAVPLNAVYTQLLNNEETLMQQVARPSDTYNKGSASDINFIPKSNGKESTPTVLAMDAYSVNAPGVSGAITPYRLDVGSVSMPREMTDDHVRFGIVPYSTDYKVPFVFKGSSSGRYLHNLGGSLGSNAPNQPSFYSGLNMTRVETEINHTEFISYILNDNIFESNNRLDLTASSESRQPFIEWMSNEELRLTNTYTNKFIDFLPSGTVAENTISSSARYKFRSGNSLGQNASYNSCLSFTHIISTVLKLDQTLIGKFAVGDNVSLNVTTYNSTADRDVGHISGHAAITGAQVTQVNTSNNTIQVSSTALSPYIGAIGDVEIVYLEKMANFEATGTAMYPKAIGGFSITSQDGTAYHFALPIFDYNEQSELITITDNTKKSIIKRTPPFANTWLLTAITGPDFIDRNQNGLADEGDWGYWVKMNYGKHTDSYDWRMPLSDETHDATNTYKSYTQGKKQLYYLNSVETRSHVALFMKSSREDGKSFTGAVSPLKLDEICVLTREAYEKMELPPYNIPPFSNQVENICLSLLYSSTINRDYINKNCIKRVVFTYSYDLCKGTPNAGGSNNVQKGKLTLNKVSLRGRNDLVTVPDFKFEYNNNPNYVSNAWDGWGMYSPTGNASGTSHGTIDPNGTFGASWSMTKLISPLGAEAIFNYERDSYSSISGELILDPPFNFSASNYDLHSGIKEIPLPSGINLVVGDRVRLVGNISYHCSDGTTPFRNYDDIFTVASVSSASFMVDRQYIDAGCFTSGTTLHVDGNVGTVAKVQTNKRGGNLRVASIQLRDGSFQNKVRYLYRNDDGSSSGVVSVEPEYIKKQNFEFYDYLRYPQTGVLYGKVSVLSGPLTSDADFVSKQEFEFETPHKTMVTFDGDNNLSVLEKTQRHDYHIEDRTSKIGRLISVKVKDRNNVVTSSSALSYTHDNEMLNSGVNNYQGVFTEGTILADRVDDDSRFNRTSVIAYPYVLKKTENTSDGFTSWTENRSWDLKTGAVLEKVSKSALGITIKTVVKPAYQVYPEMGSKADNINNRNMLSQVAETYSYKLDASENVVGLLSAEVQTWNKDWSNYRVYSGTTYADGNETESVSNKVWRKGPVYTFKGDMTNLNPDGTLSFLPAEDFNFGSGTGTKWQNLGEINRFDHFGMPLQSKDLNGMYSALKMGYDDRVTVCKASNAKYNEIAFSSAEDKIIDRPYFGGEVGLGDGTVVTSQAHTGQSALSLSSGYGFVFKTQEATINRSYRVSVWASNANGKIYYKLNGGAEQLPTQTTSSSVVINGANWYRIDAVVPKSVMTSSTLEVGVKSASGTVVFDDFRFQPLDASMTCYVYNPLDFEFTTSSPTYSLFAYTLDNDNLFTMFEYDERGALVKMYSESLKYGVKQTSENRHHYKRTTVNP